jgi:hypothetical protein
MRRSNFRKFWHRAREAAGLSEPSGENWRPPAWKSGWPPAWRSLGRQPDFPMAADTLACGTSVARTGVPIGSAL